MNRRHLALGFVLTMTMMATVSALAQDLAPTTTAASPNDQTYTLSALALTKLAVIAVILEQALAVIFDWKPFRETFDRKAVKPLVSFLFAVGIVHQFKLDIVGELIEAYSSSPVISAGIVSKLVTALVLAGGSGGINRIMQRLGIRSDLNLKEEAAPPPTHAFVSVVPSLSPVKGTTYTGLTIVGIDSTGAINSLGTVPVDKVGKDPRGILAWFLQEKGRFPPDGGFPMTPGQWSLRLDAIDSTGAVKSSPVWGPYQLAAGVRVDLTMKL